jgi:hypothetical protein
MPSDPDDHDVYIDDFLPGAGEQQVRSALDELYDFNRLLAVCFGVFVGGLVTTTFTVISPSRVYMIGFWCLGLLVLTILSIYHHNGTTQIKR